MKAIRKTGFLMACVCTAAAVFSVPTVWGAGTLDSAHHLQLALLNEAALTSADDFNKDGNISAVDLALMKRELMKSFADSGETRECTVPASENYVKKIGRTLEQNDVTWLVQSGSAVEFTVSGQSAGITLLKENTSNKPRYAVYLDGELLSDVVMEKSEEQITLFSDTKSRTAVVKVIHLSEATCGAVGVGDITVTSSASIPVSPTAKKDLSIEFIGDSITCAYGVEGKNQYEGFSTATENFTKSYAYLTAELLNADYSAVSYSGYGIISGYSNDGSANTDSLVPTYYTQIGRGSNYSAEWDFAAHPNDVIVLNLGTNDDTYCSKDLEKRGTEFQSGYEKFLKTVREKNPDSIIICTLGIMGCEELYPYVEAAVASQKDSKIICYQSPTQNSANGYGADWHPAPLTHQQNACLLADQIASVLHIPWSRVGIDFTADAKFHMECANGANASDYFSDWDRSYWINAVSGGTKSEDIAAFLSPLDLPAGTYTLSFRTAPPKDSEISYQLRNHDDPTRIYAFGTLKDNGTEQTVSKTVNLTAADENCELLFFLGGNDSAQVTLHDVTLYKTA